MKQLSAVANCPPKFKTIQRWRSRLAVLALCSFTSAAFANQLDIVGPPGSGAFGERVTVLPNGNFIVVDTKFDLSNPTVVDVGAVYLYTPDGKIISRLTGASASERLGLYYPVQVLANGNFVVASCGNLCSVTWGSGTYGVDGVISPKNSLISNGYPKVTLLNNGNYVVITPSWGNAAVLGAGAITWGNGLGGTVGEISAANSLVGSHDNDLVGEDPIDGGSSITVLANNNYVVRSMNWGGMTGDFFNKYGAVSWGSGTGGTVGVISAANSLIGSSRQDYIGSGGITALTNGNYVVSSLEWDRPGANSIYNAGAVTWGNGATGSSGVISASNSLVGSSFNDQIGANDLTITGIGESQGLITALSNGNYVVVSSIWDGVNPALNDVGAVTWGNGTTGISGEITASNSYIGATAGDQLGYGNYGFDGNRHGATALANGNYVFGSQNWHSGAGQVGAVTWGDGATGSAGVVSNANSLVGSTNFDFVGLLGVTELANGNYVVGTPNWHALAHAVGAATWGNGATGTAGIISPANSLVGSQAFDKVGEHIVALTNGNYVLQNLYWDSAAALDVGAVTWGNGLGGTFGAVSAANSLVGESFNDAVGAVIPLANGNYIVSSRGWSAPSPEVFRAGAVTWGNGLGGTVGKVSAANSIVGSTAHDSVGDSYTLSNGNYVVASPSWDNGLTVNAGAVTWGNGNGGSTGVLSAANSLIGSTTNDLLGSISTLDNGNYVVSSPNWDGAAVNVGAVTLGNGNGGTVGPLSANNSLVGSTANDQVGRVFRLDVDKYAVSSAFWDNGAIVDAGAITFAGKLGISGPINASNSYLGIGNPGTRPLVAAYDLARNHLFVIGIAANTITIFGDSAGSMFANGFE